MSGYEPPTADTVEQCANGAGNGSDRGKLFGPSAPGFKSSELEGANH